MIFLKITNIFRVSIELKTTICFTYSMQVKVTKNNVILLEYVGEYKVKLMFLNFLICKG